MTSKRLTPEQVHAVGVAALENAMGLMTDAAILLEADRPRRAFALGVIAVEEVAKVNVCRSVLGRWTSGAPTVNELNRILRPRQGPHVQRYRDTFTYLMLVTGSPAPPHGFALDDMKARGRVLYVEVADDGSPMTPEGVAEHEARQWVEGMARNFIRLAPAWRNGLDDDLAVAWGGPPVFTPPPPT